MSVVVINIVEHFRYRFPIAKSLVGISHLSTATRRLAVSIFGRLLLPVVVNYRGVAIGTFSVAFCLSIL